MTYLTEKEVEELKTTINFYESEVVRIESIGSIDLLIKDKFEPPLYADDIEVASAYAEFKEKTLKSSKKLTNLQKDVNSLPVLKTKLNSARNRFDNRFEPSKKLNKIIDSLMLINNEQISILELAKVITRVSGSAEFNLVNATNRTVFIKAFVELLTKRNKTNL